MDHHKILRTLVDLGGSGTEEQILDGNRLDGQADAAYRVDHTIPKLVTSGLVTQAGDVFTITQAGKDYIKH